MYCVNVRKVKRTQYVLRTTLLVGLMGCFERLEPFSESDHGGKPYVTLGRY